MIDVICREIRNYFVNDEDKFINNYTIIDGILTPSVQIQEGQYYRIVGSVFNDGVYIKGSEQLTDEAEFRGAVWLMKPPKAFIELVNDITAWQDKYGGVSSAAMSPYNSESFGGYSYSKNATTSNNSGVGGANWKSVFAARLAPYRRYTI